MSLESYGSINIRQLHPAAQIFLPTRRFIRGRYTSTTHPSGDFYSSESGILELKFISYLQLSCRGKCRNQNGTSNVQMWDSGNRLVEEYIRSCDQFKRYERQKMSRGLLKMKFSSSAYRNCQDSVHTGYSALSQITQLLFNDICSATRLTK